MTRYLSHVRVRHHMQPKPTQTRGTYDRAALSPATELIRTPSFVVGFIRGPASDSKISQNKDLLQTSS